MQRPLHGSSIRAALNRLQLQSVQGIYASLCTCDTERDVDHSTLRITV